MNLDIVIKEQTDKILQSGYYVSFRYTYYIFY